MLPHSHSNATARYMSHTHPACTRQHAGHTHASTWSSLPGKLEERNTHRQRGHLPTGTEHWTGQSTTQSPIQICSTELFFFLFWQSRIQAYNADSRERERETDYRQRCYEVQTKEMANHGKRKGTRMEKKKSRMRGRDVSFLHSGHPVWQRRRNLLRYVTTFEKAYFYKNDFFFFRFKNVVQKELCFYPFWLKSYSQISNSWLTVLKPKLMWCGSKNWQLSENHGVYWILSVRFWSNKYIKIIQNKFAMLSVFSTSL